MHPLCQGKSWAGSSTKIAKQHEHEETYHSDDTNEGYLLCHLRHPESLDEHQPQRICMSYDAMPWVEQSLEYRYTQTSLNVSLQIRYAEVFLASFIALSNRATRFIHR